MKELFYIRCGFILAVVLIASGWTDLDWMVNLFHNGQLFVNGAVDWNFGCYVMPWWWAYETTLWRLMMGWFLLGWLIAKKDS